MKFVILKILLSACMPARWPYILNKSNFFFPIEIYMIKFKPDTWMAKVLRLQTRLSPKKFPLYDILLVVQSLIHLFIKLLVRIDISSRIKDFALQGTWQAINLLGQLKIGSEVEIPNRKFITCDNMVLLINLLMPMRMRDSLYLKNFRFHKHIVSHKCQCCMHTVFLTEFLFNQH